MLEATGTAPFSESGMVRPGAEMDAFVIGMATFQEEVTCEGVAV